MKVEFNHVVILFLIFIAIAAVAVRMVEDSVETKIADGIGGKTTSTVASGTTSLPGQGTVHIVYGESTIRMPAVDNQGNGVVTTLRVDAEHGEGRTLVNINQLLFWTDTQYSIQTAKAVAGNYTSFNLSKADIIYTIDTEASVIEGPSAGAALTVATVAALMNKTVDQAVMITGTIKPDGTIGQVGGIVEKATAAKDVGAKLFLVPAGQSVQTSYMRERVCEKIGPMNYCTTEYTPVKIDVEQEAGIDVEEVATIQDALKYFID